MSLKEKAIKGAFWTTVQQWSNKFLSLVTFTILARLLEPSNFGLIALAGSFLVFVNLFLDQGFSSAIIQRKDLEPEHLDTAFWTNISIATTMVAVTFLFAPFIAGFFQEPNLTPILRWLSLSFLIGSFNSVQSALFQKKLNFKILAIRSSVGTFIGAIVGVTMAFMGFGVWSLVVQRLAASMAQTIILWYSSDWIPQFRFSQKHFQDLFSFGVNILGINVLNFLISNSDNLLIGYFLGSQALGYYDLGYRLLVVVSQLFVGIISSLGVPLFSRLQEDLPKLRNVFYRLVRIGNTVAFPIFLGMSFLSPELVKVIFGSQWIPAIPVMRVLSLIGVFYGGFFFNGPLLISIGKPQLKLRLDIFRASVQIIIFFLTVQYGIIAVATGKFISIWFSAPVTVFVMKKVGGINLLTYGKQYFPSFISSLVMLTGIYFIRYFTTGLWSDSFALVIYGVSATLIYLSVLYLLDKNITKEITNLLQSRKKGKRV